MCEVQLNKDGIVYDWIWDIVWLNEKCDVRQWSDWMHSCSLPGIGGIDTASTNNVNTTASGVTAVVAAIAAVHKVAILISGIAGIVVWKYGSVW